MKYLCFYKACCILWYCRKEIDKRIKIETKCRKYDTFCQSFILLIKLRHNVSIKNYLFKNSSCSKTVWV